MKQAPEHLLELIEQSGKFNFKLNELTLKPDQLSGLQ
jgi:hypothetical protein